MESGTRAAEGFASLADLLSEPLLLASQTGTIHAANAAAMRLFGRSKDKLVGQSLTELVLDANEALEALRRALRSTAFAPGTLRILTSDGEAVACRCDGAVYRTPQVRDAEPALVVLRLASRASAASEFVALRDKIVQLSRENMARRAAEEAVARSAARLRVTLESIGDAVIATDKMGAVVFMNPVAEQLTGWSARQASGRHLDEVFVILNEDTRETVESPVAKVLRLGTVVGLANHTILVRRDGSEMPIDDSGAPIRDLGGAVEGVVLVFRDLTERHALERELVAKTVRLQEADRRKDEFLSMLAHELRNPLAPLRNGVEIIRRSQVPSGVSRTAEVMSRQITHMVRLVDDLLDVSRLTRGKLELRMSSVGVPDLVRGAEEMMRPICDAHGVTLHLIEPIPEVKVRADAARLVQVLGNLIGNAAKFSPNAGTATVEAVRTAGGVEITVTDEGVGISTEELPKVFDLFFQADQGMGREQGGLGVGLTISRSIVEMHGGTLRASSKGLGHGSTFTMSLPLASRDAT